MLRATGCGVGGGRGRGWEVPISVRATGLLTHTHLITHLLRQTSQIQRASHRTRAFIQRDRSNAQNNCRCVVDKGLLIVPHPLYFNPDRERERERRQIKGRKKTRSDVDSCVFHFSALVADSPGLPSPPWAPDHPSGIMCCRHNGHEHC